MLTKFFLNAPWEKQYIHQNGQQPIYNGSNKDTKSYFTPPHAIKHRIQEVCKSIVIH